MATGSVLCGERTYNYDLITPARHRAWAIDRQLILDALQETYQPHSRIRAFATCGNGAWILKRDDADHEYAIVPQFCHDRFCVPCARQRAWLIRKNLSAHLPGHALRFITLTMRSGSEPLVELLDKLRDAFTKLRKHVFWYTKVYGGVAFIETKWSEHAHRWHPHLHILAHGKYIAVGPLTSIWKQITGTSFIVDVGLVRDPTHALRYITKYCTKPMDARTLTEPARLRECILAMRGRKLCGAFGDWAHLNLLDPVSEGKWSLLCPLSGLATLCREGDVDALLVEQAFTNNDFENAHVSYSARPPPGYYAVELIDWDADIAAFNARYARNAS